MQTWWAYLAEQGIEVDRVVGIDEAGRGPLAGPVAVAGVVLPRGHGIEGLDDSKKLTPVKREELFDRIAQAGEVFVEMMSAAVIDRDGIFVCVRKLMRRVALRSGAGFILTDAVGLNVMGVPQLALVGGDGLVDCIAAASIVAKVARDRLMVEMDGRYPGYGLAKHKGYGTEEHLEALRRFGPTRVHRRTFQWQ